MESDSSLCCLFCSQGFTSSGLLSCSNYSTKRAGRREARWREEEGRKGGRRRERGGGGRKGGKETGSGGKPEQESSVCRHTFLGIQVIHLLYSLLMGLYFI